MNLPERPKRIETTCGEFYTPKGIEAYMDALEAKVALKDARIAELEAALTEIRDHLYEKPWVEPCNGNGPSRTQAPSGPKGAGMSIFSRDFFAVEEVLQHRREQTASVKGKDTPYRVEFRYRGGTRSYQYFTSYETTLGAKDYVVNYGPSGRAYIRSPLSERVQVRGPRGGWSALREEVVAQKDSQQEGE